MFNYESWYEERRLNFFIILNTSLNSLVWIIFNKSQYCKVYTKICILWLQILVTPSFHSVNVVGRVHQRNIEKETLTHSVLDM